MSDEARRPPWSFTLGLAVILIGVLLLLDRLGIFYAERVLRFWPLLLIAAGIAIVVQYRSASGRFWGAVLILAGVIDQFETLGYHRLGWATLWPVFVIAVGLLLLWRRIESPLRGPFLASLSRADSVNIFGAGEQQLNTRDFKGGEMVAVFGGFKTDLTRAEMVGSEATLVIKVVFGTGEILVPATWAVTARGVGIFGAFEDKSRYVQPTPAQKHLIVTGAAILGQVTIRN